MEQQGLIPALEESDMLGLHSVDGGSSLWNYMPVFLKAASRLPRSENPPYVFSFNIADRCPIGCNCYWRAQARVTELEDDEVVEFFQRKRDSGYVLANIVGGEPYVRPGLLEKVAGIVPFNWLITSGTTPLRRLRRTTHVISIDGASAETHNRVRRSKGLYERILKNLGRARSTWEFPAFVHTTLNAWNYREIGDICRNWKDNGLVDGILVSTLTPIKGANDDGLRLSRDQRTWIVDELLRLKDEYGHFMLQTSGMLRLLHPDHTSTVTPETCSVARFVESYDAAGKRIPQCILSDKADCSECGCVVSTFMSDMNHGSQVRSKLDMLVLSSRLSSQTRSYS